MSKAVAALPRPMRGMLLLFTQGHSHAEIAAATSAPLGTVKTRIRQGKRKLLSTLGGHV